MESYKERKRTVEIVILHLEQELKRQEERIKEAEKSKAVILQSIEKLKQIEIPL